MASLVIGLLATSPAIAKVLVNTIDPTATLSDDGRHLVVTGPIACTTGERAFQRVTVTQRATGASAEGVTQIVCTGSVQQWVVHATTQGREAFAAGAATAVGFARTTDRGQTTDAHQWLVPIALVVE